MIVRRKGTGDEGELRGKDERLGDSAYFLPHRSHASKICQETC